MTTPAARRPNDPLYEERMQALRDRYAASLPERLQAVVDALARCKGAGRSAQDVEQLHHALHTISGSAGSFGFKELGDECRRVEQLVRDLMAGQQESSTVVQEVEQLLQLSYKQYPSRPHD
jgi:periplasmic divalent cation tolerance protein